MLGHRVVAVARGAGHDVVGTDLPDLDLADAGAVRARLGAERPDVVVHCAAYTDVDGAEADEATATRINGDAAGHVAAASAAVGAFLVHLSTDYVFAGDAERPYAEDDEPAPRTAYGRSKLAGERAVAAARGEHAICRTAWLYGAGGRNFVDTMLRLAGERDEVSVVADQVGSPTWTGHLAPALLEVAERRAGGVHHLTGEGSCSWYELAVEAFARAGVACRVTPTTSAQFVRPAPRPAYSVLGRTRPDAVVQPAWQEGVRGHLAERDVPEHEGAGSGEAAVPRAWGGLPAGEGAEL
jgi:dTDP-4-dehydrorhamnose reductase